MLGLYIATMQQDIWTELIEYARWAPSPHNIQPWGIRVISDAEAHLYYLNERLLPGTDPTGRFTYSGFGIFCECLSVAANPKGLDVSIERHVNSFDYSATAPVRFATLRLVPKTVEETLDRKLLLTRRTSRLPYDGRVVSEDIRRELMSIAHDFGSEFIFSTDKKLVDSVLDLNQRTLFYDMSDPAKRNEVGSWIRYTSGEAYRKKDGLWSYCLGYPGLLLKLFVVMRYIFELPIIKPIVARMYLKSMKGTTTIGWIRGPFNEHDGWFESGRMLARLWLVMEKHGIRLHPFGSIITNEQANTELQGMMPASEHTGDLWLIVRLGYSEEPPRSLRRSTSDITIKA